MEGVTKFTPTKEDIAFALQMVRVMAHDGVMMAAQGVTYRFDQKNKIMILIDPTPLPATGYQRENHERTVVVFGAVGYRVVETTPGTPS